jgi:WD40 repeat protein
MKKTIGGIFLLFFVIAIILIFTACANLEPSSFTQTFPSPTQSELDGQPAGTPTNIVIGPDELIESTSIYVIEVAEELWVIPYEDMPAGKSLVYYNMHDDGLYTLSQDEDGQDLKLSNHWGSFSIDGTLFATRESNDLILIDTRTQSRQQIPLNFECNYQPVWSPDLEYIIFDCWEGGIFVYSTRMGLIKHLTNWGHPAVDSFMSPVWSPDGKWIAYSYRQLSSLDTKPVDGVYIIEAECIRDPSSCEDYAVGPLIPDGNPTMLIKTWSPDSRYLAAVGYHKPLQVVDVLTGESQEYDMDMEYVEGLAWHPDGSKVLFSNQGSIYVISLSSGEIDLMVENKGYVKNYINIPATVEPTPITYDFSQTLREVLIGWDDFTTDAQLATDFLNTQIYKLQDSIEDQ